MKELTIIKQQEVLGRDFKVYGDFENPLFLAKDIAIYIEYDLSSINKLVDLVDDSEKVRNIVPTLGGNQEAWFLTEDGLYEILMQSRKPIAKQFKKEVKKILQSIRKHGAYMTPAKIEEVLLNPDTIIQLATALKEEQAKNRTLSVENETLEIALNESLQFYTVAKYNKSYKMGWNMQECQAIGKELSAYCRTNSIEIRKCETNDERFGAVNSYPVMAFDFFLYSVLK